ncbi:CBL-interacting serine/threonine-protein kinase 10-like [Abrus precatorius]|uniref:non-specific serine/threonine protein kinase n=1 Tax=Abrus precatorius TaxID=3816 RepID=A0A8B8JF42_ABRPR|nr:CBL-interacting serine/threonine-protein kinase 10-like [Abrus precatorius]XP_027330041.1 CBL-interacting serine/threonine-protein kinase 10-like [Abrus precatorius]
MSTMENTSNILMQKYELGRLLGQGTFGKVYYGRSTITNQSVALKVIDKDKVVKTGQADHIKREISVMRMVRHPHIIHLFEVMATKSKIYFVLEYAKGGELFRKVAKGKLKEEVAHKYFRQLINAVDFCHSRGVYHRDIKPENILLDENENLKVSDFGLSALAESKRRDGLLHTTCGTPAYVAPEVIQRKGYDGAKADIWSCGVVLFVLLAGHIPFHDSNLMEMYRKISKAEFTCPNWFPRAVQRLLSKMLDPNPDTRISIDKIKKCSWYRKGPYGRQKTHEGENKAVPPAVRNNSEQCNDNDGLAAEARKESVVPVSINAFDIISLSPGFNLCGFFEDSIEKREARFTSRQPASVIISKLEEIAKRLKLKIRKRAAGLLKLEGLKEGRKGILSIDAEIFEVTPLLHLVEVKKSNGDTLEYHKILKEDIRPALHDIVWVWQGDQQEQSQQLEQHQSES